MKQMYEFETTITVDDEDVDVTVEYNVTYWGHPGTGPSFSHPGDPPEGPEWDLVSIQDEHGNSIIFNDLDEPVKELIDEQITEDINNQRV